MEASHSLITGPCNLMVGRSSLYIPTLSSLVAMSIAVVDMILVCHMISHKPLIMWSREFMGGTPHSNSSLVAIGIMIVDI